MFESLWCDPWIQPIRIQNRKADGQEESRKFSTSINLTRKIAKTKTVKMVDDFWLFCLFTTSTDLEKLLNWSKMSKSMRKSCRPSSYTLPVRVWCLVVQLSTQSWRNFSSALKMWCDAQSKQNDVRRTPALIEGAKIQNRFLFVTIKCQLSNRSDKM